MLQKLPDSSWDSRTATHLLNRAGFGGSPAEIDYLTKLGLDGAVSYFVDYDKVPDSVAPPQWAHVDEGFVDRLTFLKGGGDPAQKKEMQKKAIFELIKEMIDLRDWWLKRMANGPRPFQEKMTLFWHGHFATSVEKVKIPYLNWLQNETFRQNALGSWRDMLVAVSQDPAMLIWLDNARSKKDHPNENFARELMELFTLGEGHYTERDVTEGARALTGWSVGRDRQSFLDRPYIHDNGSKTFLGVTGNLDGYAVINTIVAQPQTNRFITAKLWTFFAKENPDDTLIGQLASEFQRAGQQFRPFMRSFFSSKEFYSDDVIKSQVKSPAQWLISTTRMLERDLPPPLSSANMLKQLGQNLFAPPSVKGWDGGIAWINTSNLLNRYNFAATLVEGQKPMPPKPAEPASDSDKMADAQMSEEDMQKKKFQNYIEQLMSGPATQMAPADVQKLFSPDDLSNPDKLVAAIQKRFLQGTLKSQRQTALRDYIKSVPQIDEPSLRHAIRLLMSTPDFQIT